MPSPGQFNGIRPPERILYLGHTGSGKTGSLCSLAAAGYNVRVLDLDNGCQIIDEYFRPGTASPYLKAKPGLWTQEQAESAAQRISWVTITETYKIIGPRALPRGDSLQRITSQLNAWKDRDSSGQEFNLGSISTWGPRDILVIDGLSRLSEAFMNFRLALNQRLASGPQVGTVGDNDYSYTYNEILRFLDMTKCDEIKCHIIFICHIKFQDEIQSSADTKARTRETRGFPQTIGRAISPQIGQFFNSTIRAKSIGNHPTVRRVIVTNNDENIELKNPAPLRVKPEYDLSTGLAEYFQALRGPLEEPK